ncbi:MAG: GTP-binding protein [Oscillospiraceae bacterium]|nr:GTP-binding protein [Oscillospiraceae bacterium]
MTKIDIFSGFLGAGKTTLIRKLISEGYKNEKLVLIENEFGEIAVDGGFLKDAGVEITEMNSGCICCTLVGDFTEALKKVMSEYKPDRILIEPSGVGKLSDVAKAVAGVEGAEIGAKVTVVDAGKCRMYIRNFGEFFNDQVQHADVIVLSRTDTASDGKVVAASAMLSQLNPNATVITTPWSELSGEQIVQVMERIDSLSSTMQEMEHFHEHEHHHEHDGHCGCGHDHDHHADEVFTSWGVETPKKFTETELRDILAELEDANRFGTILRAKGFVDTADGEWIYFDYVPGEVDIRRGGAAVTGRLCVIGSKINEQAIKELFNIE